LFLLLVFPLLPSMVGPWLVFGPIWALHFLLVFFFIFSK